MGSEANRLRAKWQHYSGKNAGQAENDFFETFEKAFIGTQYQIRKKPKEFNTLYVNYPLDDQTSSEIYTPNKPIKIHGVQPDCAIKNTLTNKTIYIEVKRQDGWVEGGKRSDGRGNAHERSCKFFTPGLIEALRQEGGISAPHLPFWTVFIGDITRDPCRVREVHFWYQQHNGHFFFWRNQKDPTNLFLHFEQYIQPLLD